MNIQSNDCSSLFNLSTTFCFSRMSSTVLTFETHYYQISEIRDTNLTHSCLTHHLTCMAWNLKYCCLLIQKLTLLKRFCKVKFCTYFFLLYCLFLCLSILFTVSHLNQFLNSSVKMSYFHIFISFGSKGIFYIRVSTRISYLNS